MPRIDKNNLEIWTGVSTDESKQFVESDDPVDEESQLKPQEETATKKMLRRILRHNCSELENERESVAYDRELEEIRKSDEFRQAKTNGILLQASALQMGKVVRVTPFVCVDENTGTLVICLEVTANSVPHDADAIPLVEKLVNNIGLNALKQLTHTEVLKVMGKHDSRKQSSLEQLADIEAVEVENGAWISGRVESAAFSIAIAEKFISTTHALLLTPAVSEEPPPRTIQTDANASPIPVILSRRHS